VADLEAALFGEAPGAFVVSGTREALTRFGATALVLGEVGGDTLRLHLPHGPEDLPVAVLAQTHATGLAGRLH
jgi:hypothetical protein